VKGDEHWINLHIASSVHAVVNNHENYEAYVQQDETVAEALRAVEKSQEAENSKSFKATLLDVHRIFETFAVLKVEHGNDYLQMELVLNVHGAEPLVLPVYNVNIDLEG
jgi:hypothetical protein